MKSLAYPPLRRTMDFYVNHGVTVPEPHLYLEDPSNPETQEFVKKQNILFEQVMGNYPHRQRMHDSIERMINYPRTSAVSHWGQSYYYFHNTGVQNQSVLYRQKMLTDSKGEVFLDPNLLSSDGTTAIGVSAWCESGDFYAYQLREKGSDWAHIRVRCAESGLDLADDVEWVKFSGLAWLEQSGFFYTRYPAIQEKDKGTETDIAENCAVYYHRLNTTQDQDVRIFSLPEHPKFTLGAEVSDCRNNLILSVCDGCRTENLLWILPLGAAFASTVQASGPIQKLINEWIGKYSYLGNDNDVFFFNTTTDAPMGKVVSINIKTGEKRDIIPEQAWKLDFVLLAKDTFIVCYLQDVKHVVYYLRLGTGAALTQLPFPIGTVVDIESHRSSPFVAMKWTSFLLPGRSFYFDISKPQEMHLFRDDVVAGLVPDEYETNQVFYNSADGCRIPMFLVHRKDVALDSSNLTLLYGYGGFNISITPSFSSSRLVLLKHLHGVLAVANIRGGGEYGEKWHDAGCKTNKQNCFIDFVEAAKYLLTHGYTKPEKLVIQGGSNGGLLVGATINRAPELFCAGICQVGVMDMFKFSHFTIGHAWTSDYGDPNIEADFRVLRDYSPLHNIRSNTHYPAIMCCTGDHDDRVVPLHTLKYVAAMQHANPECGPFVARIQVAAGHGAGKPTSQVIKEHGDIYSFIALMTDSPWFD